MSELPLIQSINLYQGIYKTKAIFLGAKHLGIITIICCLILGGISFQQSHQINLVSSQLQDEKQQLNDLQVVQQQLLTQQTSSVNNQHLADEVIKLNKKIQGMRLLIAQVQKQSNKHIPTFSSYFESMAKASIKGTWLTTIKLDRGGQFIQLDGLTTAPEKVPNLLSKLGEDSVFEGRTFAAMFLKRSKEMPNLIEFKIQTKE